MGETNFNRFWIHLKVCDQYVVKELHMTQQRYQKKPAGPILNRSDNPRENRMSGGFTALYKNGIDIKLKSQEAKKPMEFIDSFVECKIISFELMAI